jgi:hypothetical protein
MPFVIRTAAPSDFIISARLGEMQLPEAAGYLSIYQRTVQPMSTGAVLVKPK